MFCGDFQVATIVFPYILTLHHHIHYLTSLTFSENGCVLSKFLELVQIFHCCDSDLQIWRTCSSCINPAWLLWKVLIRNYFWIYKECVKVLHPKISNFIDFWLIWITISHKKIINSIYTLGFISGRTPCTLLVLHRSNNFLLHSYFLHKYWDKTNIIKTQKLDVFGQNDF